MLKGRLSWSQIIKLVLLWLLLKLCVDVFYLTDVKITVFSIFFYCIGIISGIGLMYSHDRRQNEKRKRILEIIKAVKETYKS